MNKYDQEYDKNMTFGAWIWVPSRKLRYKYENNMKTCENNVEIEKSHYVQMFSYYFDIIFTFWSPGPGPGPQSGGTGPGPGLARRRFGAWARVPGPKM